MLLGRDAFVPVEKKTHTNTKAHAHRIRETHLSPRDAPGRGGDDVIHSDEDADTEEPGDAAAAAVRGGALNSSRRCRANSTIPSWR